MQLNSVRCAWLALAITIGLTGSAMAEEALVEEVVVVAKSIKASQMEAIEAKRNADNVADIISADAIGRFPDQNLADALGRIPGVSIERDQGQGMGCELLGQRTWMRCLFCGADRLSDS